jgi:hypothetical protein
MVLGPVFEPAALATANTVAVIPVRDGVSDNISDDLAESYRNALSRSGFQVVSRDVADQVLDYSGNVRPKESAGDEGEGEGEGLLAQAKESYFNFDNKRALTFARGAIEKITAACGPRKCGEALRDAYVTAGLILSAQRDESGDAERYFQEAVKIDPSYTPDRKIVSPSVAEAMASARAAVIAGGVGDLVVQTDPPTAEVYLNGILKGVTPLTLKTLPAGGYGLEISADRYRLIAEDITITSDKTLTFDRRLVWDGAPGAHGLPIQNITTGGFDTKGQIEEGLAAADRLKVDRLLLVDADESGDGGEIALRMVDRRFKAGFDPVVVRYRPDKEGLPKDLNISARTIIKQAGADVSKNPSKYLDPSGIGDPILLGKRRRALTESPAFWMMVAGVLAGAAGGAASAMGGGGGAGEGLGSIGVQFK